jgi:hypothetical protein
MHGRLPSQRGTITAATTSGLLLDTHVRARAAGTLSNHVITAVLTGS